MNTIETLGSILSYEWLQ